MIAYNPHPSIHPSYEGGCIASGQVVVQGMLHGHWDHSIQSQRPQRCSIHRILGAVAEHIGGLRLLEHDEGFCLVGGHSGVAQRAVPEDYVSPTGQLVKVPGHCHRSGWLDEACRNVTRHIESSTSIV